MNKLDLNYQNLLQDILDNGVEKNDRTGTGTISVFGRQIRHKMSEGFPLLTTKKMAFKTMVTELLWFLRGDTNIKYLVDNNCHIWDGDAYKNYISKQPNPKVGDWENYIDCYCGHTDTCDCGPLLQEEFIDKIKTDDEFAKKWGELGPIYGKQWRSWGRRNITNYDLKDVKGSDQPKVVEAIKNGEDVTKYGVKIEYQNNSIDQIQNLINDLKTNPDSRRLMVNAWNVSDVNNGSMVLPPCHYGFQVYTRELTTQERFDYFNKNNKVTMNHHKLSEHVLNNTPTRAISLMFNMRSNDVPLGLPFNIASYGLLLEIFGKMVNMIPDELIVNIGDGHIYKNQIDGIKEQLTREPYPLPKLVISDDVNFNGTIDDFLNSCSISDLKIEGYQSHPPIKIPLSN